MTTRPLPIRLSTEAREDLAALLLSPSQPAAAFVFAHGAGAGMEHPFMTQLAEELCGRGVATLRFQFPFMQSGLRRPDPPAVAQRAVRAAVAEASQRLPGIPLFAGGKSFGGRMTSQAQAAQPLADVRGLVFVGFPLHPAGKPSTQRADHLGHVGMPMLFLQGTRDALADLELIRRVVGGLDHRAALATFDDADHAFHVRARSGSTDAQVVQALSETAATWMSTVSGAPRRAI